MAVEWREIAIGELAEIFDGPHATPSKTDTGPVFLGISNLAQGRLDLSDTEYLSEEDYERWTRRVTPSAGDVVFSYETRLGEAALIPPDLRCCLGRRMGLLRAKPGKVDARFLLYAYLGPQFQETLRVRTIHGSTVDRIPLIDMPEFQIHVPADIDEQRAIAHILGTLDDKIQLNRRMNETLETMAGTLFKSWFVDFDPVRAKTEGCDTGLPKHIADLFPDSVEDSEFGEIPKGWTIGRLGDVLRQRVERCIASAETVACPYVPIDCISPKSLFLTESKPGEEAQSSLIKFYKGDLLFGAMRPYFHKVCIAPFDGTTRTTAFVLYPKRNNDFSFAALLLHQPETIDYATRHSTGSTIPYAVWSGSLEDMPVLVPPAEVREEFNNIVRPILIRIPEPYFENCTLAALRDALLPKLISGELRVKDAKRFIGGQA